MKLHLTLHEGRLGPARYQVVRPARPVERAVVCDDAWYLNAFVDAEAARTLAGLWTLAATSPRSLVHLPLRVPGPAAGPRRLDLVLLHRSLQFAPSGWKELRGRLDRGRPRTVTLPAPPPQPRTDRPPVRRRAHHRAVLHQHIHAETLFLTGSTELFREGAEVFRDVAEHGPAHTRTPARHGHYCASIRGAARTRDVHVEYSTDWAA
ncbi:hypothetical protein ABZZ20_07015 [Streptomyces sp. NPDC006430]|uniref:hypothetical protein n=1 Tax=Streptomyces sp. NPDC006430 TaxID=3154299 RepID=UPI0033AB6792